MIHSSYSNFSIVPQLFRRIKFMIHAIVPITRLPEMCMRGPKLKNSILLDYLVSNWGMVLDCEWGIYRIFFYQGDSPISRLYFAIINIIIIIIIITGSHKCQQKSLISLGANYHWDKYLLLREQKMFFIRTLCKGWNGSTLFAHSEFWLERGESADLRFP